jgi:hypothetical protein
LIYSCVDENIDDKMTTKAAVALSDGMVVLLNCSLNSGLISWGVLRSYDQFLLSYPAIGISGVNYSRTNYSSSATQYVTCCLRGGTTYLFPFPRDRNLQTERAESVLVFPFPHDVDADSSLRQLQSFVAGNVFVSPQSGRCSNSSTVTSDKRQLSIFVYCWPGGLIDIYSCGLILRQKIPTVNSISSHSSLLLNKLVDNGSANILQTLLESIDSHELERMDSEWKCAHQEVLPRSERKITYEDICSESLDAFRSILIRLGTTTT